MGLSSLVAIGTGPALEVSAYEVGGRTMDFKTQVMDFDTSRINVIFREPTGENDGSKRPTRLTIANSSATTCQEAHSLVLKPRKSRTESKP